MEHDFKTSSSRVFSPKSVWAIHWHFYNNFIRHWPWIACHSHSPALNWAEILDYNVETTPVEVMLLRQWLMDFCLKKKKIKKKNYFSSSVNMTTVLHFPFIINPYFLNYKNSVICIGVLGSQQVLAARA